ncbi:hypothetical protein [Humibacillus xanthopallidus]|uniref:hypothetical protein n=1 Tax=Humibacillus xanthopallidus TaxID=412689 RepID=UPI00384B849F
MAAPVPASQQAVGLDSGGEGGTRHLSTTLFVRMWAAAHVIHLAGATDSRLDTPWNIVTFGTALIAVWSPRGRWLAVMAGAQVLDLVVEMPYSPDHWILAGAVNVAILLTLAWRRSCSLPAVAAAFPAARWILLIAYSAAALSKYNVTFLDPLRSCAGAIADTASFGLTRESGLGPAFVMATIAFETLIPILLMIRRTRRHGVRVAMVFHFILSASPGFAVVDFTAALYALFLLFLADEDVAAIVDRLARVTSRSAIVRDVRRAPWLAMALAFLALGFLGYASVRVSSAILFVASEVYLIAFLAAALLTWRTTRSAQALGRPLAVQVFVLLVVVVWAAMPYIGVRTSGVFTMFSGLRTEGASPNHVFMPSLQVSDWASDLVIIKRSNDPRVQAATGETIGLPVMGIRRLATENPALVVEGTLNGAPVTFGPGAGQIQLQPLTRWEDKLLLYRPVAVGTPRFCTMS